MSGAEGPKGVGGVDETAWVIRGAAEADLDALAAIECASHGRWQREAFAGALRNTTTRVWVAQAGAGAGAGAVVAFLVAWVLAPECEIHNIATAPSWRRRGVARALVRHLERVAREAGVERIFLEVRARGQVAQALYRSLGFVMSGVRRGYYADDGDDAWVMERRL